LPVEGAHRKVISSAFLLTIVMGNIQADRKVISSAFLLTIVMGNIQADSKVISSAFLLTIVMGNIQTDRQQGDLISLPPNNSYGEYTDRQTAR
jgi:uncharacterized membrane protein